MTVVFSGGGGLLLLMQPASRHEKTNALDKPFIVQLLLTASCGVII
jgi:hypothetical protein